MYSWREDYFKSSHGWDILRDCVRRGEYHWPPPLCSSWPILFTSREVLVLASLVCVWADHKHKTTTAPLLSHFTDCRSSHTFLFLDLLLPTIPSIICPQYIPIITPTGLSFLSFSVGFQGDRFWNNLYLSLRSLILLVRVLSFFKPNDNLFDCPLA